MKTTELYIEQVLIGFLVIAIVLMPWMPPPACLKAQVFSDWTKLGLVLGMAFLLGTPFDRLADTLVERLDDLHRLGFAFGQASKHPGSDADPYPEDKLLFMCLRDTASVIEREDYHRSRIRLTRALAVYGPGLTMSATIWFSADCAHADWMPSGTSLLIIVAYAIWTALVARGQKFRVPTFCEPHPRGANCATNFAIYLSRAMAILRSGNG